MKTYLLIGIILGVLLGFAMGEEEFPDWYVNKVCQMEGFKSSVYKCSGGARTIGYGFNLDAMGKMYAPYLKGAMTREKGRYVLSHVTLPYFASIVDEECEKIGFKPTNMQRLALTSFTFNLGRGGLQQLLEKRRTRSQICLGMKLYIKSGGQVRDGLVKRREWESCVFNLTDEPISFEYVGVAQ